MASTARLGHLFQTTSSSPAPTQVAAIIGAMGLVALLTVPPAGAGLQSCRNDSKERSRDLENTEAPTTGLPEQPAAPLRPGMLRHPAYLSETALLGQPVEVTGPQVPRRVNHNGQPTTDRNLWLKEAEQFGAQRFADKNNDEETQRARITEAKKEIEDLNKSKILKRFVHN